MLTVLMWVGILYAFWVVSGYLAFRLVNKVQKGRHLMSNHFWSEYHDGGAKVYWPLRPEEGLRYMFIWGFGALFIACTVLSVRGIQSAYNKQFDKGINHSIAANRFFGIK